VIWLKRWEGDSLTLEEVITRAKQLYPDLTLNPVETIYRGYRFRSRLEARWAVFFDTLGIPFEYEPEGFELPGGLRYLPDFWLPEQGGWVEIKGREPTEEERLKAQLLAAGTGHPVYIFFGPIEEPPGYCTGSAHMWADGGFDLDYWWCECRHCGRLGIKYMGRSERLPCRGNTCPSYDGKDYNYDSPRLVEAYTKARSARFERFGRG